MAVKGAETPGNSERATPGKSTYRAESTKSSVHRGGSSGPVAVAADGPNGFVQHIVAALAEAGPGSPPAGTMDRRMIFPGPRIPPDGCWSRRPTTSGTKSWRP